MVNYRLRYRFPGERSVFPSADWIPRKPTRRVRKRPAPTPTPSEGPGEGYAGIDRSVYQGHPLLPSSPLSAEDRMTVDALTIAIVSAQLGQHPREVAMVLRRMGRRSHERPDTYDHPLAVAARAGRYSVGRTTPDPIPDPGDERQVRAYRVARARALARRWGDRAPDWARLAGHDNRRSRRGTAEEISRSMASQSEA